MKKGLPYIIIIVLACFILFAPDKRASTAEVIRDTIFSVDTVTIRLPSPKSEAIVKYVPYAVTKTDTVRDTAFVYIPITQRVYKDSSYTAYVSGYDAKLDSLILYNKERTILIRGQPKNRRFGLGIQAGYAYPIGCYVGVGVSYNLFTW